jgi:hypothetical protein
MPRPSFSMLRFAAWLLAFLVGAEVVMSLLGGLGCWWANYTITHETGACMPLVTAIREQWSEALAAILALLLAARNGNGGPPKPPAEHGDS